MHYNHLSIIDRIEKTNILTNRIIVKALQSERGGLIREMKGADLEMMMESVFRAVYNKVAVEAQRAYDYKCADYVIEDDHGVIIPAPKFEPKADVEIEEEVSAYFEIDGKLQYREVAIEPINNLKW